ncbi:MAG: amidase domain-containing protein [Clostridium sp.]
MKKIIYLLICGVVINSLSTRAVVSSKLENLGLEREISMSNIGEDPILNVNYLNMAFSELEEDAKTNNSVLTPLEELEESLEKVNKEENYIFNLINSLNKNTGIETTVENFKYNLEYLKTNYDYIKVMKNINIAYVDSYIWDYEVVLKASQMESEKKCEDSNYGNDMRSYRPLDAIAYANKYYKSYNKAYPDWTIYGGDCANFISQCLKAGGKKMSDKWYSYGNKLNTSKVSPSWRGANDFSYYWRKHAKSYKTFKSVNEDYLNYGKPGDVISFINKNGRAVHTMMITGLSDDDFILSTHTYDTNSSLLKVKASRYPSFIIYNM